MSSQATKATFTVSRVVFEIEVPRLSGKERARAKAGGGYYTPRQTRSAEQAVAEGFLDAVSTLTTDQVPLQAPVALDVAFCRELPKSAPKRRIGEPDISMPDIDNLLKLVMDALTGLAWEDDRYVYSARAVRLPRTTYGSGCQIRVAIQYG
ncbi:MAG: RusA family crossover junction endodeoxyribonuclease [Coriobacteriia bacterium]|nr:RusA family crossover junction endodeoxyribonuclease [Coriobacteriia bacterium]